MDVWGEGVVWVDGVCVCVCVGLGVCRGLGGGPGSEGWMFVGRGGGEGVAYSVLIGWVWFGLVVGLVFRFGFDFRLVDFLCLIKKKPQLRCKHTGFLASRVVCLQVRCKLVFSPFIDSFIH